MRCPKCNERMIRVEISYVFKDKIVEKWQCPACGFTTEKVRNEEPISDF